jgi:hypothetical protein
LYCDELARLAQTYGVAHVGIGSDTFGLPRTIMPCARNCAPLSKRRPCMSETAPREWQFYIDDMIGFSEKIIAYTAYLRAKLTDVRLDC